MCGVCGIVRWGDRPPEEVQAARVEEMIQALRELTVNVDSAQGDTVRVFCE